MRVLVVDDSLTMRKIIVNVLKQLGFKEDECITSLDGLDAWHKILHDKFDIILTDWNMPHMSGLDLVKNIRHSPNLNHDTPIIMITSEGAKSEVIDALKAGVTNYIVKPFNQVTLKTKLDDAIKRINFVV